MTRRQYECEVCGIIDSEEVPIGQASPLVECCGRAMNRVFNLQTSSTTFQAYIEPNLPGGPVEMKTPQQRDAIMDGHGMSYDSYKHCNLDHKKNERLQKGSDVSYDEVMTTIKKESGEWL